MELKDMAKYQEDFERKLGLYWKRTGRPEDTHKHLIHSVVIFCEEFGEYARTVNKMWYRDRNKSIEEAKMELVDVFIYLLKFANYLDVDLEAEYFAKMKKNERRYRKRLKRSKYSL